MDHNTPVQSPIFQHFEDEPEMDPANMALYNPSKESEEKSEEKSEEDQEEYNPFAETESNKSDEFDESDDSDGYQPSEDSENSDDSNDSLNRTERFENSVVFISATAHEWDYKLPWQAPKQHHSSGSGFIMNYNGNPYLITNAHVAENAQLLQVRLANETTPYIAKVKIIDHDCDLAILEVDSPIFWTKTNPLELGKMPTIRNKIDVFGFPVGGEELCITEGKISRIEVREYAQASTQLLQAQLTAHINPGNSGGPVLDKYGEVVGVAFQGACRGNGLNYMIPVPILNHFMEDATYHSTYRGFPSLGIDCQTLQNQNMRNYYGMKETETGVRIKEIDHLSSVKNKLQPNDILLALDEHPIENDGMISTDFAKRVDFQFLFSQKHIGDVISATILRDHQRITVELPLIHREYTTKYTQEEHEKKPTYYINSGIVLQPLTDNFCAVADDEEDAFESYKTKAKKQPGDEIVILNHVLGCEHTRHIADVSEGIVKKINGQKIRNLREAIEILESSTEEMHRFHLDDKDIIMVKNLSKEQNKALLKEHSIKKPYSDDLKKPAKHKSGCPESTDFNPFDASSAQDYGYQPIPLVSAFKNAKKETQNKHVYFDENTEEIKPRFL